jgi:uridylate kinase
MVTLKDNKNKWFVLSLGGSLIIPNGGADVQFLHNFNKFIREKINRNHMRFFIVCGGGATSRHYMEAGKKVDANIPDYDLDWLGTHATRLNAQLLRTLFRDICYQKVLKHYELIDKNALDYKVVIGGGWKPGWSTDYDAVMLAADYRVTDTVVNLSDILGVYDKDPKKFSDAKLQPRLTWDQIIGIVGKRWKPGMRRPFDPIASKLAKENHVKVIVCKGHDLKNLDNILEGKEFTGTVIE